MTRTIVAVGGALLLSLGRFATAAPAQEAGPATVDVEKSYVVIFVDKTGLGHQHGVFGKLKEGSVQLGAKQNAGKLVFDMATFSADTTEARRYVKLKGEEPAATRKQITETMLGKDVLDAKRYPTATFEIESATLTAASNEPGEGRYTLKGKLTLHGAGRPLQFGADADEGGAHLHGEFSLLQTQYGIKPYTTGLGAVGVADKLIVHGELYFKK